MQHVNLVSVYERAQYYYAKRQYKKARKLFASIVSEIGASDTDSMADIELHNCAMAYLRKAYKSEPAAVKPWAILLVVLLIGSVVYLWVR